MVHDGFYYGMVHMIGSIMGWFMMGSIMGWFI